MRTVEASAPGKAILCGEYAVLAGAPAIVVALDRRVKVRISESRNEWHEVSAPGLSGRCWKFSTDCNRDISWHEADAEQIFSLFSSVWRVLKPDPTTGLSITIDSRQLHDPESGAKTGIGSSAAVATSLVAALARLIPVAGDPYLLAQDAHRDFQDGGGSGADIAASYHGGTVVFSRGTAPLSASWPAGLRCRFFWSGLPADTVAQVAKIDAGVLTANAPGSAGRLAAGAVNAADSWVAGDAAAVLSDVAEFASLLKIFADDHDLDVFGAGHLEISELASQCGIVYKPCGAGGGDIGVALSVDDHALASFCSEATNRGFRPLEVAVDDSGVTTNIKN